MQGFNQIIATVGMFLLIWNPNILARQRVQVIAQRRAVALARVLTGIQFRIKVSLAEIHDSNL